MPMQSILSFISAHWMEWAIGLLSFGWGYLIKKMTEYKNIKDGLLAIMHDRLYQMSTFFLKEGYINTAALKNLEYLYKSYHALGLLAEMALVPNCTLVPRVCQLRRTNI